MGEPLLPWTASKLPFSMLCRVAASRGLHLWLCAAGRRLFRYSPPRGSGNYEEVHEQAGESSFHLLNMRRIWCTLQAIPVLSHRIKTIIYLH